jgi:hypothetical protein
MLGQGVRQTLCKRPGSILGFVGGRIFVASVQSRHGSTNVVTGNKRVNEQGHVLVKLFTEKVVGIVC